MIDALARSGAGTDPSPGLHARMNGDQAAAIEQTLHLAVLTACGLLRHHRPDSSGAAAANNHACSCVGSTTSIRRSETTRRTASRYPTGSAPDLGHRCTLRIQRLRRAIHSGSGSSVSTWKPTGPKQVSTSRAVRLDPSDSSTRIRSTPASLPATAQRPERPLPPPMAPASSAQTQLSIASGVADADALGPTARSPVTTRAVIRSGGREATARSGPRSR